MQPLYGHIRIELILAGDRFASGLRLIGDLSATGRRRYGLDMATCLQSGKTDRRTVGD